MKRVPVWKRAERKRGEAAWMILVAGLGALIFGSAGIELLRADRDDMKVEARQQQTVMQLLPKPPDPDPEIPQGAAAAPGSDLPPAPGFEPTPVRQTFDPEFVGCKPNWRIRDADTWAEARKDCLL